MKTVAAPVNGVTYIHTDGLGSPVAKSDANGNLIAGSRTRYEPYGMTVAGTATPTIGFTGHVNDADTGLTYMQQRYYDPVAGRFLSTDPVLTDYNSGASFNRYTYALNNPYKYVDPDGRDSARFYGTKPYLQMVPTYSKDDAKMAADIGTDLLPLVGTAKSIGDAIQDPSLGNVGMVGMAAFPGGRTAVKLISRIKESAKLVKEAQKAGKSQKVQKGLDHLTEELAKGNKNPGIESKAIGDGISEARDVSGARVYFQEKEGAIEILGKSGKDNQQKVIDEVKKTFKD